MVKHLPVLQPINTQKLPRPSTNAFSRFAQWLLEVCRALYNRVHSYFFSARRTQVIPAEPGVMRATIPPNFFQALAPPATDGYTFRDARDLDTLAERFPDDLVPVRGGCLQSSTPGIYKHRSGDGPILELRQFPRGSGITAAEHIQDAHFVVNSANPEMVTGGGIAGAFFEAAPGLHTMAKPVQAAIRKADGITDGRRPGGGYTYYARPGWTITSGPHELSTRAPALKGIIHVVAPNCQRGSLEMTHLSEGQRYAALYSAYRNIFAEVETQGGGVVVIPPLGTGIYAFSKTKAAQIAVLAFEDYTEANRGSVITTVRFLVDEANHEAYQQALLAAS